MHHGAPEKPKPIMCKGFRRALRVVVKSLWALPATAPFSAAYNRKIQLPLRMLTHDPDEWHGWQWLPPEWQRSRLSSQPPRGMVDAPQSRESGRQLLPDALRPP